MPTTAHSTDTVQTYTVYVEASPERAFGDGGTTRIRARTAVTGSNGRAEVRSP